MSLRFLACALFLVACGDPTDDPPADDGGPVDQGLDAGTPLDVGPPPEPLPACDVTTPDELSGRPGLQDDGSYLALDGRRTRASGPSVVLEGFPAAVAVHPTAGVAYVVVASNDDRRLDVVDLGSLSVVQALEPGETFYGIEVAPDGSRVYLSGGHDGFVRAFDAAADGTLTAAETVDLDMHLAGLAIADDGATLWVGAFEEPLVVELNAASLVESRRFDLPPLGDDDQRAFDVHHLAARDELYVSDLRGEGISVIDLSDGSTEALPLPTSPAGLASVANGSKLYAAVSGSDTVVVFDPATRTITDSVFVAAPESDLANDDGDPLPNSNVNALWYDDASDRLYVSRGADNSVSVLDGTSLEVLGSIGSDQYPTDVELAPDGRSLVITSGKGAHAGPNDESGSAKNLLKGTVAVVDLMGFDLAAATTDADAFYRQAGELFAPDCERFIVPTEWGGETPIRHVVLIVKENKTFDSILGDLDDPRVDADPSLADDGLPYTPNHHALAAEFAHSDNFYVQAPNSDSGHIFLTGTHLTELAERYYLEDVRHGLESGWPLNPLTAPSAGNLFTHVVDHGLTLQIYGEIVGTSNQTAEGEAISRFTDGRFPGGPFTNYAVTDEDKARYVASRIEAGHLASFTYLLLPNDHGNGTRAGSPTPESMTADNDYGMGIVIDALSHSPFWPFTVVIVLEDDPQGSRDHVESHRSVLHVASPWAKRDYVSHTLASFTSVIATIERLLQLPPLGRPDATAAPLYDMFTNEPDYTPYDARERTHPPELNGEMLIGSTMSMRMDFRSPDRNPELGELTRIYRDVLHERITRDEGERRMAELEAEMDRDEAIDEDADDAIDESLEDAAAFDSEWAAYQRWYRRTHGRSVPWQPTLGPVR